MPAGCVGETAEVPDNDPDIAERIQRHAHLPETDSVPRQLFRQLCNDDVRPDIGDYRLQPAEIAVGGERSTPSDDPRALGGNFQVARENRDVFRLRLVEDAKGATLPKPLSSSVTRLLDQDKAKPLDPLHAIAWRRRREGSSPLLLRAR